MLTADSRRWKSLLEAAQRERFVRKKHFDVLMFAFRELMMQFLFRKLRSFNCKSRQESKKSLWSFSLVAVNLIELTFSLFFFRKKVIFALFCHSLTFCFWWRRKLSKIRIPLNKRELAVG
jgi:hypothetical protein